MKLNNIAVLCCLGLAACDDPGACNKMTAAQFFVDFRADTGRPVDWSLKYIANEYILKVDKTDYIDKRYGSRVCKMVVKNATYEFEKGGNRKSDPTYTACFVYVPRTKSYSIALGLPGCCNPYYANENVQWCYF
ncbi:MAG: hypothetical protein NC311_05320 [Muribaculaceae bacterium]|nr:hypothetical protein [Muribaculaceae bacterium]